MHSESVASRRRALFSAQARVENPFLTIRLELMRKFIALL
jgi:hypothetical protein